MTHALLRIKKEDDISPHEQDVGAFIAPVFLKEDNCNHITLSRTKPVICTLIENAETAEISKNLSFIQFVGNQPVYAHIVEPKQLSYRNEFHECHI